MRSIPAPPVARSTATLLVACSLAMLSLTCAAHGEEPNHLSQDELEAGWILLFDGETDYGWKPGSDVDWKVADGVIRATTGKQGLLYTTSQFANYVLQVDFRSQPGTNSGIFLRTPPQPTDPTKDCYELNIADWGTTPFATGSFVGRQAAAEQRASRDWQSFEVTADGGHFTVQLNGKTVLDYVDSAPLGRGHIGLQFNSGTIEFRNIKLKPLGLKPLFTGDGLTGWKVFPDRNSRFSRTPEGWLHVENGNGQLESDSRFADFVLQVHVRTNGKLLNSGIFFRCIPGEFWQGYESQIHNGFLNGDRTKPLDFGTGAFYRRQKARRVVSDDFAWFAETLVVNGPHMATWINGICVCEWTDTREANANPRQGLRLEAGTVAIQGHDATTDIMFRDLNIAEMPPR